MHTILHSLNTSLVAGLFIVLTVPALYEKYEDHIDRYVLMTYKKLLCFYLKFDAECISKTRNWIAEKKKLD